MPLTLIALGLLLLSSPSRAAEQVPKRHAISAEFFFPEDVDNRDIRVATLSAEAERKPSSEMAAVYWVKFQGHTHLSPYEMNLIPPIGGDP